MARSTSRARVKLGGSELHSDFTPSPKSPRGIELMEQCSAKPPPRSRAVGVPCLPRGALGDDAIVSVGVDSARAPTPDPGWSPVLVDTPFAHRGLHGAADRDSRSAFPRRSGGPRHQLDSRPRRRRGLHPRYESTG